MSYPSHPELAVGALVIHAGCVLLVKRATPPAQHEWALPGGRVKLGETLQAAAEREIREETGLIIRAGDTVHSFELIEHDAAGRVRFHYLIVDVRGHYVGGELRTGDDAQAACWVATQELADWPLNTDTHALLLRERILEPGS